MLCEATVVSRLEFEEIKILYWHVIRPIEIFPIDL